MKKKIKKAALFIVDSSVLEHIFEGKNDESAMELINKMGEFKARGIPFNAVTTLPCFLLALWKSDPKLSIKEVQSVMELIEIAPTNLCAEGGKYYKNKGKVLDDLIEFAKSLSRKKK